MDHDTRQSTIARMTIESILTGTTCGLACWEAREDICRCSCGGDNHGCLRHEGGVQPARTAKIDGFRYTLIAVGNRQEVYSRANPILRANEKPVPYFNGGTITYRLWGTEKGGPARVKPASKTQVENWPELASFRNPQTFRDLPYLLWLKDGIEDVTGGE